MNVLKKFFFLIYLIPKGFFYVYLFFEVHKGEKKLNFGLFSLNFTENINHKKKIM